MIASPAPAMNKVGISCARYSFEIPLIRWPEVSMTPVRVDRKVRRGPDRPRLAATSSPSATVGLTRPASAFETRPSPPSRGPTVVSAAPAPGSAAARSNIETLRPRPPLEIRTSRCNRSGNW
jgi:hypothetical protein